MRNKRHAIALGLAASLALATGAVMADTLSMPVATLPPGTPTTPVPTSATSPHEYNVEMPVRGMTMTEVTQHFGQPREKRVPVGQPPITRWVYPKYTVYFEYKYVIDSVLNTQH